MAATTTKRNYKVVVIGVSAGGLTALDAILPHLHADFKLPLLIVQHLRADYESFLATHFDVRCSLKVKESEDKEPLEPGVIYFAPPNYHLMVEYGGSVALSTEEKVNFSRPAIDVLFETAATVYKQHVIGIVLTGANADGAAGLAKIKALGGLTIVQDPDTAEVVTMPCAAIKSVEVDHIIPLDEIAGFLNTLSEDIEGITREE